MALALVAALLLITIGCVYLFVAHPWWFPAGVSSYAASVVHGFNTAFCELGGEINPATTWATGGWNWDGRWQLLFFSSGFIFTVAKSGPACECMSLSRKVCAWK